MTTHILHRHTRKQIMALRTRILPITLFLFALLPYINLNANEVSSTGELRSANGKASVRISKPHVYAPVFLDTDQYSSNYLIDIPLGDRGKSAFVFMAATHNGSWYMKGEDGWKPWQANVEPMTPFANEILSDQLQIQAIDEVSLEAGDYEIFAGYQIPGQDFVVAPEPLKFRVLNGASQTLFPFGSDAAMESFLKQGLQSGAINPQYAILESTSATDQAEPIASSRVSGTNLQLNEVDEADLVKTDGQSLFTLRDCSGKSCIVSWSLDGVNAIATEQSSQELTGELAATGMYLVNQRTDAHDMLITLAGGNHYFGWRGIWGWQNTETQLEFFDASNPANLVSLESITIEGQLVSSRRIGETLYLVTRYTPNLPFYQPYALDDASAEKNEEVLASSSISDLLPKAIDSSKQSQPLVTSERCYFPTNSLNGNTNPSLITVTVIPLSAPKEYKSTCFVGETETVFMTTSALYLATTQYGYESFAQSSLIYNPEHSTSIHKFSLQEDSVSYVGSGQVEGHFGWSEDKKSFRMGENGDYLNVVTSVGDTWGPSSSTKLTVLKETDTGKLSEVAAISGIGKPGERLYAARFIGEKAYLVTFRLTDPLYVIDLSDQNSPRIAGELEIEGYSDYLHPVDDNLVVGIGKDAVFDESSIDFGGGRGAWYQGLKLALFDVSNGAMPLEINSIVLGKRGTESDVLANHHALSFLPATGTQAARLAIPVQLHDTIPQRGGFDPTAANARYDYTHTGLYSFEISPSGISQTGLLLGRDPDSGFVFGNNSNRSVLLDNAVFYIHQGEVLSSFWGEVKFK